MPALAETRNIKYRVFSTDIKFGKLYNMKQGHYGCTKIYEEIYVPTKGSLSQMYVGLIPLSYFSASLIVIFLIR
jgi:hypothetical protein